MSTIRHAMKEIFITFGKLPAVKMATDNSKMKLKRSNVKFGTHEYVQYIKGGSKSKIIISAPHGGNMRPNSIPNRRKSVGKIIEGVGEICVKSDLHTKEIALLLQEELTKLSSKENEPHLVICELHRSKLDANRKITEATLNVPNAITAYNEFHEFLSEARREIGTGILLDLHGHAHPEGWVELGYLVSKEDLLSGNLRAEKSSIRSLASSSKYSFEDLVSGSGSLGKFLQDEGIEAIPSPKYKSTKGNCYTGGYNIAKHGSFKEGKIDAIQIEMHRDHRSKEQLQTFVTHLATAISHFMDLHYGSV